MSEYNESQRNENQKSIVVDNEYGIDVITATQFTRGMQRWNLTYL